MAQPGFGQFPERLSVVNPHQIRPLSGVGTFESHPPALNNLEIAPEHPGTWVKLAQIKIIAAEETVEKFKRIVLTKHGKLELSAEGEEALKLYIKKYERLLGSLLPPDEDPLKEINGIGKSSGRHNVLKDLERLEVGEY